MWNRNRVKPVKVVNSMDITALIFRRGREGHTGSQLLGSFSFFVHWHPKMDINEKRAIPFVRPSKTDTPLFLFIFSFSFFSYFVYFSLNHLLGEKKRGEKKRTGSVGRANLTGIVRNDYCYCCCHQPGPLKGCILAVAFPVSRPAWHAAIVNSCRGRANCTHIFLLTGPGLSKKGKKLKKINFSFFFAGWKTRKEEMVQLKACVSRPWPLTQG